MSLEDIININIASENDLYNVNNKGYKYNLPAGFSVYSDQDYNQILLSHNNKYYLNIDIVGYYYKNNMTTESEYDDYKYYTFENNNKNGYLRITENNGYFFVELCYNYAIIEVEVKEDELKYAVSRSILILNSIKYNDLVITKFIEDNDMESSETIYNIPEPENKTDSKNILEYIDESDSED
jgi:riboflavin synthase